MSLARELANLNASLGGPDGVDVFDPAALGQMLADARCAPSIRAIETLGPLPPASVLRVVLQALRVQHDEFAPRLVDVELVATLPPDGPAIARPTQRVVHEMIESARHEIILLGYEVSDEELVQSLANASRRDVSVIVICDRGRGVAQRFRDHWPSQLEKPRIFHDRERLEAAPFASMHAKAILVDQANLLVTSANFTFHGFTGNIEIGLRVNGAPAREARRLFSFLVERQWVEEIL